MNYRGIKVVFLDLDGTLAHSLPVMYQVYLEFLAEQGRQGSQGEFQELNGPSLPEVVAALKRRHGLMASVEELLARYRTLVQRRYPAQVRPAPGARRLLEFLRARGYRVGLVTSSPQDMARSFLKAHRLLPYFEHLIGPEGLTRSKPHPDIYLKALRKFGIKAVQALAVEDSLQGIRAAQAAGIQVLWLAPRAGQYGLPQGAEARIERLDELAGILAQARPARREYQVFPVPPTLSLRVREDSCPLDKDLKKQVDAIWMEEVAGGKSGLFNGSLLCYKRRRGGVIYGRFVEYKCYLAQRRVPALYKRLKIRPLGVSGVIRKDGSILFARRSAEVTQYPDFLELVPSGGINRQWVSPSGAVRFDRQLVQELKEEAGIPCAKVAGLTPVALVFDRREKAYDICLEVMVEMSRPQILECFRTGSEYRDPLWVRQEELAAFLSAQGHFLVPTSLAILEVLGLVQRQDILKL